MNNIPTRTDIATRTAYPKDQLLRFVLRGGEIVLDEKQEMLGRGVYLYPALKNLEIAVKKRLFERHFHVGLSEKTLEAIKEKL